MSAFDLSDLSAERTTYGRSLLATEPTALLATVPPADRTTDNQTLAETHRPADVAAAQQALYPTNSAADSDAKHAAVCKADRATVGET